MKKRNDNSTSTVYFNDKFEFPQGEKFKCIGPCYPAEMLFYHPLTLQGIKNKYNSCPIRLTKVNNDIITNDKCKVNTDFDYDNYDMFADIFQVAKSDDDFLNQIYNIRNIHEVEIFLENNLNQLPNLSQIRILNSIYKVYRDNDLFPSKTFILNIKKILKNNYNIDLNKEKILNKIMLDKHNKKNNDLFKIF